MYVHDFALGATRLLPFAARRVYAPIQINS